MAYAAHADAAIYSQYGAILLEAYEASLREHSIEDVVTAYRRLPGAKCNIHFASEVFAFVHTNRPCVALCFDIEAFFDTLDHRLLLEAWQSVLGLAELPRDHAAVYRALVRFDRVERRALLNCLCQSLSVTPTQLLRRRRLCEPHEFRRLVRKGGLITSNTTGYGIPQGSPMSGVVSNIYMLAFDRRICEVVAAWGGFYRRYSDDIIIIVPTEHEAEAEQLVADAAAERRLRVQHEKTERVRFPREAGRSSVDRPLQYLGLTFDGERILIRSQTLSRYYRKLRGAISRAKAKAAKNPGNRGLYTRKLMRRYSHRGRRNFVTYARLCSEVADSQAINRQIRGHWPRIARWTRGDG